MAANELDITSSGQTYRATLSRALSFNERRDIDAMNFNGNVSTLAEAQKLFEMMLSGLGVSVLTIRIVKV